MQRDPHPVEMGPAQSGRGPKPAPCWRKGNLLHRHLVLCGGEKSHTGTCPILKGGRDQLAWCHQISAHGEMTKPMAREKSTFHMDSHQRSESASLDSPHPPSAG